VCPESSTAGRMEESDSSCTSVGQVFSTLWGPNVPIRTVTSEINNMVKSNNGPHEENGLNAHNENL